MSFSDLAEQTMLASVLENTFIGLVTTTPTDTSPGIEVSAAEYARQPWSASYTQGNPTTATNMGTVEFPQAVTNWGQVTHAVLFTAATGGVFIAYMELRDPNAIEAPLPKVVTSGDILRFQAGAITFELE